jgi:hypothetical protein
VNEKGKKKKTSLEYVTPPIPALLVSRNVTAQAPYGSSNISNNNNTNTNTNKNSRTQSQNKYAIFNIKQQRVIFLKLNRKEGKNM